MTVPPAAPLLGALALPSAPPVTRATAAPVRRRTAPAVLLLVLGAALVVGPVVGGLFTKVASGQQMIDTFAPHLTLDALGRYDEDLTTLRTGAAAIDELYAQQKIPAATYPGVEDYRRSAPAIDARASTLLDRIEKAEPDYRKVADIGGFDRVPFLLVAAGLALTYAGGVLLRGARQRAGSAVLLALAAALALAAYPLVSSLPSGSRAGARLQDALAPVMRDATVRQQQDDFVILVHALGELDTSFRAVPRQQPASGRVDDLVAAWPSVSSDLAGLVGAINDNIHDYEELDALDGATQPLGFSGLVALPWFLIGLGAVSALAAVAALPRRRKGQP
ncbi:MAG: hypothetical protein JWQ74_428 [Marmoricola sp.]|nr:hypothetical protein [Marmoricola sp.]